MSLKNLNLLNLAPEKERDVNGLLTGTVEPEQFALVRAWIRQCLHRPTDPELVMKACDEILEGFGVEALEGEWLDSYHHTIQASYVNMGDSYVPTVIRDHLWEKWRIESIGDVIEREPERFRAE